MVELTIRCHPCAPVAAEELEGWLEREAEGLRAEAPGASIRLSRLTQSRPRSELYVGWLIELQLPHSDPLLSHGRLSDVLRDMRLLGLEPTLLTAYHGAGGRKLHAAGSWPAI